MPIRKHFLIPSAMCIAVSLAVPVMQAIAEEVPIVEGTLWGESTDVEKKSYLVGVSNFIVLEYTYQSQTKQPPTPDQSSVPDFFNYTDDVTLDGAIQAVNDWYRNNPSEMDTPVLTVLWKTLVEPKL